MTNLYILVLTVFFCFQITIAQGQDRYFPLTPKVVIEKSNCELNSRELDILNQSTKQDELIIIVSYLGKNENNSFGQRRLHNAKTLLLKRSIAQHNRPSESILIVNGEQAEDRGYLDFYIKGHLELRIFINKNQDLSVLPCAFNLPDEKPCETDFEKLFYPCKSKNNQKLKKIL